MFAIITPVIIVIDMESKCRYDYTIFLIYYYMIGLFDLNFVTHFVTYSNVSCREESQTRLYSVVLLS